MGALAVNRAIQRREAALARYNRLTLEQQNALNELLFAIPRHQSCLRAYGVRHVTLRALERQGLARLSWWTERNMTAPVPFWTLTQDGAALYRAAQLRS